MANDHDFTQYGDFGDSTETPTFEETVVPTAEETQYDNSDPQLAELSKFFDLTDKSSPKMPARYSLPGDPTLAPSKNDGPMDLSSIPYQQRADYQAEQLVPGEQAGIPELQRDDKSVQKASYKNSTVSNLMSKLGQVLPQAAAAEMPAPAPMVPTPTIDPMAARQAELDAAQADQRDRLADSTLRGASTDALNAALMGWGVKERLTPGYADQRLNEQTGLKIKDLEQQMKLSSGVNAEEEAKRELVNATALNDPNSPETRALRQGMKTYFGDRVSDEVINKMSGQQLSKLNKELGGIFDKIDARAQQDKQFKLRMDEIGEARADREEAKAERMDAKEKTKLEADTARWSTEAMKTPAYKRFQENQESYSLADKLAKGEISPNGVDDGALVLQAIKLAQADSSVVRESDQKLFARVGGLAQDAQSLQQRIIGGGALTPATRKAFVDMMLRARTNLKEAAKDQTSHLYKKFKDSGVPEDYIPGTLQALNKMTEPSSKVKSKDDEALEWANKNPNDPRAVQIKKKLGY